MPKKTFFFLTSILVSLLLSHSYSYAIERNRADAVTQCVTASKNSMAIQFTKIIELKEKKRALGEFDKVEKLQDLYDKTMKRIEESCNRQFDLDEEFSKIEEMKKDIAKDKESIAKFAALKSTLTEWKIETKKAQDIILNGGADVSVPPYLQNRVLVLGCSYLKEARILLAVDDEVSIALNELERHFVNLMKLMSFKNSTCPSN